MERKTKKETYVQREDVSCLLPHDVVTLEHGVALRVTSDLPVVLLKPAARSINVIETIILLLLSGEAFAYFKVSDRLPDFRGHLRPVS
jgi:hypothetical protein